VYRILPAHWLSESQCGQAVSRILTLLQRLKDLKESVSAAWSSGEIDAMDLWWGVDIPYRTLTAADAVRSGE
jgi:hypothetical protein